MISTSAAYKAAIKKKSRQAKLSGTMTLKDGTVYNLTDSDIMQGSLTIDNACVNGQDYELGAVYMAQLKATINTQVNRYKLYGAIIILYFSLKINTTDWESIPLGVYKIDDAVRKGNYTSITAYDNMTKLDKPFTTFANGTAFEILAFIGAQCGIQLAQTQQEIDAMSPQADGNPMTLSIPEENDFQTFRDLLSDVAVILGGFGTIDRSGNLEIRRFGTDEITIEHTERKSTEISDYNVKYTKVTAQIGDSVFAEGDDTGENYTATNELWNVGGNPEKQLIVDNIYNEVIKIDHVPSTIEIVGDPSIELGDKIKYTGGSADTNGTYSFLMAFVYTYRGGHKLIDYGSNPLLKTAKTKTEKSISNVSKSISEKTNKVIKYQSVAPYTIDDSETMICQYDFQPTGQAIIMFVGQAVLNVTNSGTFKLMYKINNEIVGFSPEQIAHEQGKYTLNMFYPISEQTVGIRNRWAVFLYSDDGGEGEIVSGSVISAFSGTDLLITEERFDGYIDIDEYFTLTPYVGEDPKTFTAVPTVFVAPASTNTFSDTFTLFEYGGMGYTDITDSETIEFT